MDSAHTPKYSFDEYAVKGIPIGEYAVQFAKDVGLAVESKDVKGSDQKTYAVKLSPEQWFWYQNNAPDEHGVSYAQVFDSFMEDANKLGKAAGGVESALMFMTDRTDGLADYINAGLGSGTYHRISQRNQDAQTKIGVDLSAANKWLKGIHDTDMFTAHQQAQDLYGAAKFSQHYKNTHIWNPPANRENPAKEATAYRSLEDLEAAGLAGVTAVPVRLRDDNGTGEIYYMSLSELSFADRAALVKEYDKDTKVLKNAVDIGSEYSIPMKAVPGRVIPALSYYGKGRDSVTVLSEDKDGRDAADLASAVRTMSDVLMGADLRGTVAPFDWSTPRMMAAGDFGFNVPADKKDPDEMSLSYPAALKYKAGREGTAKSAKGVVEKLKKNGVEDVFGAVLGKKVNFLDMAAGSFVALELARKSDENEGDHKGKGSRGSRSLLDIPEAKDYGRYVEALAGVFPAVQVLARYASILDENARFSALDSANISAALNIIRIAHAEEEAAKNDDGADRFARIKTLAPGDRVDGIGRATAVGFGPSPAASVTIGHTAPAISEVEVRLRGLCDQLDLVYSNLDFLEHHLKIQGYDPTLNERMRESTAIKLGTAAGSTVSNAPTDGSDLFKSE